MIGNDMVDLAQAAISSNWKRSGWLDKLFISSEQDQIYSAVDPQKVVWVLWSMKEAAYKAHQRQYQLAPKFNPKAFECKLLSDPHRFKKKQPQGKVHIGGNNYVTFSELTECYVHTIASLKRVLVDRSAVLKTSNAVALRKEIISQLPNQSREKYVFKKNALGIPTIYLANGQATPHLVSLSHHGRFGGYAITL